MANTTSNSTAGFLNVLDGYAGSGASRQGIAVKAFVLNIAVGLILFVIQLTGFFLLKSSAIGRRIYQPKRYLVQERLRVEAIPANPIKWISRIFAIEDSELKHKCGLDGYFFIRMIRALLVIFVPLMVIIMTILLPINYNRGKFSRTINIAGNETSFNVTGLDTLSWQNVSPDKTNRYWAHLVCAILAVSWTLYRIYREKLNFIDVRQRFLTSPEHRLKASARTVLITNIPSEYRSKEALEALYDVFVDNDDHSKLTVWLNRDYGKLRGLVNQRRSLRHGLEKEELRIIRLVNKKYKQSGADTVMKKSSEKDSQQSPSPDGEEEVDTEGSERCITTAFDTDCSDESQQWRIYLKSSTASLATIVQGQDGKHEAAPWYKSWSAGDKKKVSKIAWLRAEIARLNAHIEELLSKLDDEEQFKKQNSAFIQFDNQMSAHMACSLASHTKAGRMSPRFLEVAPHEIIWPNMGVTSLGRVVRTFLATVIFLAILILWGPLTALLLMLLVQLAVPAICRKLAVLVGTPTRSKREIVTQNFYFTFLIVELVLVTSISAGVVATVPEILSHPYHIPNILGTNLPKSANYFFNYLIIQCLGFSGSVLFQYLRILYITTIWPWFTQTPRQEAWLQTTIPHQMWGNVYSLFTNFAAIGLIYSIISPLMLLFVSLLFGLCWVAYRHNYYYVQRNKIDTHGLLFNNALSQLLAGIYIMEFALIGLFFLARNIDNDATCKTQAIIMIVVMVLTASFHYGMERHLQPLYEFLPVALEDSAVDAERERFLVHSDKDVLQPKSENGDSDDIELSDMNPAMADGADTPTAREPKKRKAVGVQMKSMSATAAQARKSLSKMGKKAAAKISDIQAHMPETIELSRRLQVGDQLAAAIAGYPDELTDLSHEERQTELKAAFQDPATRDPMPVIWLPQDPAGISEDAIKQASKYGQYLQYSNEGAHLTSKNKVEVTQPAPDVRPDWLLDWVL